MNDDLGMRNEWIILGKDNSPTLKDNGCFHQYMIEWLIIIDLFLLLSIEPIDYNLLL